jgi:hypothetical protein
VIAGYKSSQKLAKLFQQFSQHLLPDVLSWEASGKALLVTTVLVGAALLACVIATLIWPPRCRPGDRIAIGEALLLGGCDGLRRQAPSLA